ncbi:MAG: hypothetical protein QG658_615 [Patescibacteria group bacterium]|nr:hypothetical protein [Patescibacteria group bacterium]
MKKPTLNQVSWTLVIIATLIPVIIWSSVVPLNLRFATPAQSLGSLGRVTGLLAIVLYCINLVLSTRWRFVEQLFGGLNKAYVAHHLIGGLAISFALIHPILLSLRIAESSFREAALQLLPTFADLAITLGVLGLWLFIGLMIVTFFVKLPYRIWLLSHKFLGLAFLLMGLHVLLISSDTSRSPLLFYYILAWLVMAAVAFIYRTLLPRFFVRRYEYEVTETGIIAPGVVRLIMKPKHDSVGFESGQFIFVSFRSEGLSHEWHPFTVSSNSAFPGISITVKSLGSYTKALVDLAPSMKGQTVWIEGAYGRFSFRNFTAKKQVWVAGGIGVTPFLSMISDVADDYDVDFYYSVKTPDEMVDYSAIVQTTNKHAGKVRFFPIITDKDGFLTAEKIASNSGDLKTVDILICGPPPMMHALTDQFVKKGIAKSRIHTEEFSMS